MEFYSAPSKTFLVGEYAVIQGGAALLLSTGPRFEMRAQRRESHTSPFHTQSPAGRYFQDHRSELSQWELEFKDPHREKGGFGASSAQLLMLMVLREQMQVPAVGSQQNVFTADYGSHIYQEFAELSRRLGSTASGADLMTQVAGGVTLFKREPFELRSLEWTLPDLDFVLIRTGFKIPTHFHIRDLKPYAIDVPEALVREAEAALMRGYQRDLVQSVREYRAWLNKHNFEVEHTTDLINELESSGLALTAKGCGAMGADVVLALSPIENRQKLRNWAHDRGLQVVATRDDLSPGIQSQKE